MPHHRQDNEASIPHLRLDYSYLSEKGEAIHDEEAPQREDVVKLAILVDYGTMSCVTTQVLQTGDLQYTPSLFGDWVDRIGHKRLVMQTDTEHSASALARGIKQRAAADIILRCSPKGSSASFRGW